jgi:hypothetical protein
MINYTIQVGDYVHGRLYNEDRTNVAVQNFIVSEIDGTVYKGAVLDCDTSAGWEIELIRKSTTNLNLPSELSEITAYSKNDKKIYLTGKNKIWRDNNGKTVDPSTITKWEIGHV